jgi:hypothetical protein
MRRTDVDEQRDELIDDARQQTARLIDGAADTGPNYRMVQRDAAGQRPSTRAYLEQDEEEIDR